MMGSTAEPHIPHTQPGGSIHTALLAAPSQRKWLKHWLSSSQDLLALTSQGLFSA